MRRGDRPHPRRERFSQPDPGRELKELGLQLAVDDFGAGYSSLQYLRGFPIDILKIAKSFIDGVGGASDESALARAIIDLGESFHLRVVAEGIEYAQQLDRLLRLGCELGQGFLFARPMAPAAIEKLLTDGGSFPKARPWRRNSRRWLRGSRAAEAPPGGG